MYLAGVRLRFDVMCLLRISSAARANAADEITIGDFVEAIDGASIRGQSQGASPGAIETNWLAGRGDFSSSVGFPLTNHARREN